jgi:two-component system NtrC family sensor kinase
VTRPRQKSALGLLRVLLVASVAVPLLLFLVTSWLSYRAHLAEAVLDLERTSEVACENATRAFELQQDVAARVNDLVRDMDVPGVLSSELSLHHQFAALIAHIPQIQSVLLAAGDGEPLVSASFYPAPHGSSIAGRDYFRGILAPHSGPFISRLQMSPLLKRPFFGFGRRWRGPDGAVKGVIDIAVAPHYFEEFYGLLVDEEGSYYKGKALSLIRDDGELLLRYPPVLAAPPKVTGASPFLRAIAHDPQGGVFQNDSLGDPGRPLRIFAYRRVNGFPLYVVAGRSKSAILAEWWQTMFGHLAIGVPGTLALFAITWLALIRTRREERALAQADAEMAARERAEQALLRAQRLEAVGQLTGGVAHDFNNLLTVIIGSVELLERRPDDVATVRRLARNIKSASERGAEITAKLLAFSRQQRIDPRTADVNASLRAFEPLLRQAVNERVTITFDLAASVFPVSLDPGQFEAAVLNLVGNARDAMPQGGRITIATRNAVIDGASPDLRQGPAVRVIVRDDGAGMDAETAAKAIEPFFTTKGVGRGTGLGLSQVYGFAKQSGGDLRIETAPGCGASIELVLPACLAEVAASPPVAMAQALARPGAVVLVVEDEPDVRAVTVEGLRALGYRTLSAANADAALDILRCGSRIDLLFSDVVMPGARNGVQLAAEARRLHPGLKVLLTSGYNTALGTTPGDLPVLSKPYDSAALAAQVREILGG